ncbi:unnamed protein product [Orchesella dallaii]|uniref:EGF-like domain-containing protein n=1 Tax=Orchesella dallaii TaxID=48710 RepID=A0ABP1QHJ7_9HEXA
MFVSEIVFHFEGYKKITMAIRWLSTCCVILLTFLTIEITANRRASHGEPCSRTERCDSRASLTCKAGICECMMADTMIFNSDTGTCAVLAGEKCLFTAVEDDNNVEERSWREEIPCLSDASCENGFCTCYPGFYEAPNGSCAQKKGHREVCESQTACKDDQLLICNNEKVCDCNGTVSTYDFARQTCVGLAGGICNSHDQCVTNAYCSNSAYPDPSVCQCDDGYFENNQGACERRRDFGEPCQNHNNCRTEEYRQLICNANGRCDCNSTSSIYDASFGGCIRKAGAACRDFHYCVPNSRCTIIDGRPAGEAICKCESNYFISSNGKCEPRRGFRENCDLDENCKEGLSCYDGTCQCNASESVYNPKPYEQKCVRLVNSSCDSSEDCVPHAECRWQNDKKVCTCGDRYTPSVNGTCLETHNGDCGDHWIYGCDHNQGLVCNQAKCKCKYENYQRFDTRLMQCISRPLAPCDEVIPCDSNSTCRIGEGHARVCECNEGLVHVDGSCQLTVGQPCKYEHQRKTEEQDKTIPWLTCDTVAPLSCIDNICQCSALQVYDEELKKCRGKVGSLCNLEGLDPEFCIEGAKCRKRRSHEKSEGICQCLSGRGWVPTKESLCTLNHALNSADEDELTYPPLIAI